MKRYSSNVNNFTLVKLLMVRDWPCASIAAYGSKCSRHTNAEWTVFKCLVYEFCFQRMNTLPLVVLENVLIKACAHRSWMETMNQETRKTQLFVVLSSVSYLWWQTLSGLPQPDPEPCSQHWVRRRVRQLLNRDTRELCTFFVQKTVVDWVRCFCVYIADKKLRYLQPKACRYGIYQLAK